MFNPILFNVRRKTSTQYVLEFATCLLLTCVACPRVGIAAEDTAGAELQWDCRADDAGNWQCRQIPRTDTLYPRLVIGPGNTTSAPDNEYDWIPLEQLTPEQRQKVISGCCGAYISPERTDDQANVDPNRANIDIEADNNVYDHKTNVYTAHGNVVVTQGSRRLQADEAKVDENEGTAEISGGITVREPGLLLRGDKAEVNLNAETARIEGAKFVLHDFAARGSAATIERTEEGLLVLDNGKFSRCEPEDEQWALLGSNITIDPEKHQGSAKNMRLHLYGVPVFYAPYLIFPVGDQRQSGFLFPSFTSEDIAVPYYLNLAPNYDLTLSPRVIREHGTMLEAEFRHLSPLFFNQLSLAWLGNGKDGISDNEQKAIDNGELTAAEAQLYDGEDRWLVGLEQQGGRGHNWYSTIDYTKVSDQGYFRQLDTTNLEVRKASHLLQAGELGYRFDSWLLSTRIEEYQTILEDAEEPYRQKPKITANGNYAWGDWQLSLNNELTQFEHRDEFYDQNSPSPSNPRIVGDRLRLDYRLDWDKEWLWGFFKPSAMLKNISYRLDDRALVAGNNDSPSITVPQGSLDMGLFFERDGSWFGNAYVQTFEPRIFYFYSDFESHKDLFNLGSNNNFVDFDTSELTFNYNQLFRDSRFSGGDRIEDANQVSVGLTTRFLGSASGAERFRVSVGQIYYQGDRRVTLNGAVLTENRSEIAGQFAAQLTDSWRFSSDVLYDAEDNVATSGNASLRYVDDDFRIFNLSYRYTRNPPGTDPVTGKPIDRDDNQGDVSFIWPLTSRWSVIGRANHDFTHERELDSIFGLEYTSCCYRIRLVGRRWLDDEFLQVLDDDDLEYDEGVFFEFQFRGLGGLGNKISNALSEGVVNYDKREEYLQQH